MYFINIKKKCFAFVKIKSKEMFGFRFDIILYKTLHKIKIE